FGEMTLESAVSREPTYVESQFPNARLFQECLDDIKDDFGGKIAQEIEEIVNEIRDAKDDESRGPRWVEHKLEVENPSKAPGRVANLIIEGDSGSGKTTLRELVQKALLASGCVEGLADIHYEKLDPALRAEDHSGMKIPVLITKLGIDGELVEDERLIEYTA